MSIDVQASRDAGFKVEYMPPPPDYREVLHRIYHVLRGTQVALENQGMVDESHHKAVYRGCIDGLVTYLQEDLGIQENTVAVILHAIEVQRGVAGR
jgi:hypothetical protein